VYFSALETPDDRYGSFSAGQSHEAFWSNTNQMTGQVECNWLGKSVQLPNTVIETDNHRDRHRSRIRSQRLATPNFRPFLTKAIDYADQSALTFSAPIRPGPGAASRQPQNRNSLVRSPLICRANQELGNFAAIPEMSHGVIVPNGLADLIAQTVAKVVADAGFGARHQYFSTR
jgi:hypothetical protein